tara:strand:- start:471 stop:635 length:165 start_codon:yes stop_codon:yes gene_type:complete
MNKTINELPFPNIKEVIKKPKTIRSKNKDGNIKFLDDIIADKFLTIYFKKKIKR